MICPTCKTVLAEFDVKPGVRIIVTIPAGASPEMVESAQRTLAETFPENPVVVHTDQMSVDVAG